VKVRIPLKVKDHQ